MRAQTTKGEHKMALKRVGFKLRTGSLNRRARRFLAPSLIFLLLVGPLSLYNINQSNNPAQALAAQDFSYTGWAQTFIVPQSGAYKLEVWGAQGGASPGIVGGNGGYSVGEISLAVGDKLSVYVGGQKGYNGGGSAGGKMVNNGGGGTDIRFGGTALTNRIIVAGGGGGADTGWCSPVGGAGGGLQGTRIDAGCPSGYGGTQSGGGASGGANGQAGSLGLGGRGLTISSQPSLSVPGGGGGYYGGGSGGSRDATSGPIGAAGGGSGYVGTLANAQTIAGDTSFPAPSGGDEVGHTGNGYAKITQLTNTTPPPPRSPMTISSISPDSGIETGDTEVTLTGANIGIENLKAKQVSAGNNFALIVADDGYLYAWGSDNISQLGDDKACYITGVINYPTDDDSKQQRLLALHPYSDADDFFANESATLGVTVTSWDELAEVYILERFFGTYNTMAELLAGEGYSTLEDFLTNYYNVNSRLDWLYYSWASFTDSEPTIRQHGCNTPQRVVGGDITSDMKFSQVSAGVGHAMALDVNGHIYAWGSNGSREIGNGTNTTVTRPWRVVGGDITASTQFVYICAMGANSAAIDADGKLYMWGAAIGNMESKSTPWKLNVSSLGAAADKRYSKISIASTSPVLMLDTDGNLYSWGGNNYGQIGNGSTTAASLPWNMSAVGSGDVAVGTKFSDIATGHASSMALDVDGNLYTWGYNNAGQLGNNATDNLNRPWKLNGGTNSGIAVNTKFAKISAHGSSAAAIDTDGNLYRWGSGYRGDGTTTSVKTAWKVNGSSGSGIAADVKFDQVNVFDNYTIARTTDSTVYIWGVGSYGQQGNGTFNSLTTPWQMNWPITVTLDAAGTPAACKDISTGAANLTTNITSTSIKCKTSPHAAGLVSVAASNGVDVVSVPGGFRYAAPYVSLSLDSNSIKIGGSGDLTPSVKSAAFGTASNVISVKTNHNGYKLSISTDRSDNFLKHLSLNEKIAPAKGSWVNKSSLDDNRWGFTLDSNPVDSAKIWTAVPFSNYPLIIKSTLTPNETATGDQTTIHYGAKVNLDQRAGDYQTTIVYTAVGKI
jgi:alpha-tubulin suppressor-like RCC1 family protein